MSKRLAHIVLPISSRHEIEEALKVLFYTNCQWLIDNPDAPYLYDVGVLYTLEPMGLNENWQTYKQLLESKRGDCEDLACAIASWRFIREHKSAKPMIIEYPGTYHIVVGILNNNGNLDIEDPSYHSGMKYE